MYGVCQSARYGVDASPAGALNSISLFEVRTCDFMRAKTNAAPIHAKISSKKLGNHRSPGSSLLYPRQVRRQQIWSIHSYMGARRSTRATCQVNEQK
jgi:hypothetical protein